MDKSNIKDFMQQHVENYRNAVIDIIHNNTTVLVDEDITSLFRTPPLDSMDLLRTKLLNLAKGNKVVFKTEALNKMLDSYRLEVLKCCPKIKKIRENTLINKISKISLDKKNAVIRINKKDFVNINREIKNVVRIQLVSSFEKKILNKIDSIFSKDMDIKIKSSIIDDLSKYVKSVYKKQLLENVDIKILVKDTTLMNNIKEQSDRYLFTLKNSRLLNDLK